MDFNIREYGKMLDEKEISVIYSGPIWSDGIDGMAEMLIKRLTFDELDESAAQSVFSVFVEQMNNILMYSAEKAQFPNSKEPGKETSKGIFVLGIKDSGYFVYTGNAVKNQSAKILKERIDCLNALDKKELRQLYKRQVRAANDNPESQGAGIGLIEIARRSAKPIQYGFEPIGDGLQYFAMCITIQRGGRE